jgi:5-methylcytosine-specific restriction protein A
MPTRPPRAKVQRCANQPASPPRASARKRGYDSKWDEARAGFLAKHPFCDCPLHKGKPDAPRSTAVDHIIPHKGDKTLFWTRSNWRAMAKPCHDAKTAREDGGFGRPRQRTWADVVADGPIGALTPIHGGDR